MGETLTAGIGDIADLDGLPATFPDDYTLQWIRVDANGTSNPVDVGTDDDEYTLVAADEGKKIKLKVGFTDDGGTAGERTSDAFPSSGTIAAAAPCDGVWCATLNVKALDGGNHFGCANSQSGKACSNSAHLTEDEFTHALTDYAVTTVQVRSNGQLRLWVNPDLATGSESLVLHVGSRTFAFQAANTKGANHRYWNNSGLSWSAGEAVALKLTEAVNAPATGKPEISGTIEVGETLTADTSRIADADGLTSVSYSYRWVRVDGSNETDIAGATGSSYTLVAADEGKGIRVRVSFTDDAGNPETLASDVYRAVTILPAPRLPSVDDPNAIWMATLTVANLGSNQYGYKGSQGGLTDTAFTYLGDDTPLSGGTYRDGGDALHHRRAVLPHRARFSLALARRRVRGRQRRQHLRRCGRDAAELFAGLVQPRALILIRSLFQIPPGRRATR